jgi:DNA repair ATPase RecN
MDSNRRMTALEVHQFKKFLDQQVDYGKNPATNIGLARETESVVKELRRNLNKMLGDEFPEYGALNKTYSESIDAINELQRLVPRVNLSSDAAAKQVGTLLRRLDSNAASKGQVEEMVGALDDLGNKYGGSFTDDVKTQVKFAFELDKMFGTSQSGSFSGQIGEALANSPRTSTAASELARIAAEKLRGVNQQAAFESMQELLKSFD